MHGNEEWQMESVIKNQPAQILINTNTIMILIFLMKPYDVGTH